MIAWFGKIGAETGFETTVLDMPNTNVPTIDAWLKHLDENVYYVDQDTYFIGHSIGCQAVLRYLEANKASPLGGCILVAPYLNYSGHEEGEDKDIARPWIERPIDFSSIRKMSDKFVAILSDNDLEIALEKCKETLERGLHPKIIIEHGKGHFTRDDGVTDLPIVLEELKSFK